MHSRHTIQEIIACLAATKKMRKDRLEPDETLAEIMKAKLLLHGEPTLFSHKGTKHVGHMDESGFLYDQVPLPCEIKPIEGQVIPFMHYFGVIVEGDRTLLLRRFFSSPSAWLKELTGSQLSGWEKITVRGKVLTKWRAALRALNPDGEKEKKRSRTAELPTLPRELDDATEEFIKAPCITVILPEGDKGTRIFALSQGLTFDAILRHLVSADSVLSYELQDTNGNTLIGFCTRDMQIKLAPREKQLV